MTESIFEIYQRYEGDDGILREFQRKYNVHNGRGQTDYNAVAHANVSAAIAFHHGEFWANVFGEGRELRTLLFDAESTPQDGRRDTFNNRVGVKIANYAIASALTEDALGELVVDALNRGLLAVNERTDSRVNLPGKELFVAEAVYDGPSAELAKTLEIRFGLTPGSMKPGTSTGEGSRVHWPELLVDPPLPVSRPENIQDQSDGDAEFREGRLLKPDPIKFTAKRFTGRNAPNGDDSNLLPEGVRRKLEAQFSMRQENAGDSDGIASSGRSGFRHNQSIAEIGTNNEQMLEMSPIPRPRPKLNPITEGYLKDMPDDGRLILAAEMVGFNGRKGADKAEAERLARFDVQRKMAQDLEDVKAGKVSTVWDRYGHPKAVRDLLGEEAYQSFVDDRLEAGIISNATAGLHLLQDAELFGIADGTTALEAPHEKLAELMTPKVLAAAAERARDILDMRRTKPSDAVLLSSDLSNRKARFDAAFDANEAVDAEEMDAFLFYHEAAQREVGIAEPAIEIIPPRWASQVAARFDASQVGNGTPTDSRAREAELKQHYAELRQSFGSRTDDVIAYSLARTASNRVFRPDDGAPAGSRAQ